MNNIDKQYLELLKELLITGRKKKDRTGTGTISLFNRTIRHNMKEGFPLLTTKKVYWKGVVTELLWFLRGETNIKYLLDNDCHIWDGDAYKAFCKERYERYKSMVENNPTCDFQPYEEMSKDEFIDQMTNDPEFSKRWDVLGPIYGKQWRKWAAPECIPNNEDSDSLLRGEWFEKNIDQIADLINNIKTDPDSRRLIVSAWNVGELNQMALHPCHYEFQCYTYEMELQERIMEWCHSLGKNVRYGDDITEEHLDSIKFPRRRISLKWTQRSVDVPLGLPFNIASYGLLLEIIAMEVNMISDELIGSLGDCHIYLNQLDGINAQLKRTPYELPTLKIPNTEPSILMKPKYWKPEDFVIENYKYHPPIKIPLSN